MNTPDPTEYVRYIIPLVLALFAVVFSLTVAIWATCATRRLERGAADNRRCPYCLGTHERTSR